MSRKENVRLLVGAAVRRMESQIALAQELALAPATISKWLSGRTRPNQDNEERLCAIVSIGVQDLDLDGDSFRSLMFGLPVFKIADVPLRSLRAVEDHRESWAGNWKAIQGIHRFFYAQKNGTLEISEISFVALHKSGIVTRMRNLNTTDAGKVLSWHYEGYTYIINDFAYVTLSHVPDDPAKKGSELFFMIFRLSAGADGEPMFGHLLARGTKGREQRSATSPCVLMPVREFPELEPLMGAFGSDDPRLISVLTEPVRHHLLG